MDAFSQNFFRCSFHNNTNNLLFSILNTVGYSHSLFGGTERKLSFKFTFPIFFSQFILNVEISMLLYKLKQTNVNCISLWYKFKSFITNFNMSTIVQNNATFQFGHQIFVNLEVINFLYAFTNVDMIYFQFSSRKCRCFADHYIGKMST